MANAWIIRPLPMTVTGVLGTSVGDPAHIANDYMGVGWVGPGASMGVSGSSYYHVVDLDIGRDQAVDTILGLGIAGIPSGAAFYVWANTEAQGPFGLPGFVSTAIDRSAGTAELPGGVLTFQWNAPAMGVPPAAARYWRILLIASSRFDFRLARVVIGKRIAPAVNFQHGAAFGVRDLGGSDFSRRGVLLRRRGAKLRTVGLTFSALYRDEVEAMVQPMLELVGSTEPVALITDPAPDVQLSRRTYYGPLTGDIGTIQRRSTAWQASFNLVSLI